MCNEPTAPTEETPQLRPIACKEASIYLDDTGEAISWVQVYADMLPGIQHHCLINQLMIKPPQLDDTLHIPYSSHLSRQEILEAEQETAIKPDQILTRKWPDIWGLPVYEVTEMELDDCE